MINPVLAREIRSRVRDWRSPLLIVGYVGALGCIALLYFQSQVPSLLQGNLFGPQMGLNAYNLLAFFQLMLISFIVPAVSSGAISGEKERQTFDLLWCTKLNARSIILGKLAASVAYTLLVVVATAPLYSVIFFFGGLAPGAIALTLLVYLVTGIMYSAISIFCSTLVKRTMVATVLAYSLVFFLLVGTLVTGALEWSAASRREPDPANPWQLPPKTLYLNPIVAITSALPGGGVRLPYIGTVARLQPQLRYRATPASISSVAPGVSVSVGAVATTPPPAPKLAPAWQYNLLADGLIIAVMIGLSIVLVDPTGPASRLRRRRR